MHYKGGFRQDRATAAHGREWLFLETFGRLWHMDKAEHGRRLRAAMASHAGGNRTTVADAVGVGVRTVTNWTSGKTMPSERERVLLRRLLGPYDQAGDPVELAVRSSELIEWRQDAVVSTYKRHLHEQRQGEERAG